MTKKIAARNNGNGTGGRPSKLDPATYTKLLEYISAGVPVVTACSAVGLNFQTIQNWCERGEADGKGPFFEFLEQYQRSRAEALIMPQLNWRAQMPTDWRACQAYLRVRDPDHYGEPERTGTFNVQGENVLIIVPEPASAKQWNKQVQKYLSNGGLDGNRRKDRSS